MGVVTSDLWIALELHGTEWKPVCLRTTEPQAVGLMNMTSAPVPLLHLQAAN